MKKTWIIVLVVVGLLILWTVGRYNSLVNLDESVKTAWSQVENVYQRRADLIPNLVNTVKGYANHESGVLLSVTQARADASQTNLNINDAQALAQYQKAQSQLSSSLSRLLAISENYPDLKANQNFRDLQVQLEGTENRISVERMNYNNVVKSYNITVRRFPLNIVAGILGFTQKNLFEAQEGSDKAPVVNF